MIDRNNIGQQDRPLTMAEPQQEGEPNGALIRDVNHDDDSRGLLEESSSDDDTSMDDDTSVDDDSSMDDGSSDDDSDSDDVSSDEELVIPTPDEVELEYTYPDDFQDRAWQDVVEEGQYYRLNINCEAVHDIPEDKFFDCGMLIEIVFLNNNKNMQNNILRYIGEYAFYHCYNLQRIRNGLPMGLLEMGEYAFKLCTSLQQGLIIPRNVLLLDIGCFHSCKSITSVVFDHLPTDPVNIRRHAFCECSELRSVTLPISLRSIPSNCFRGYVLLIHILIPIPVRVIGFSAFIGCSALRHIDLSENITAVHENAYSECSSLTTVTIKSSTVQFGRNNFAFCPSLSTIKVYPWVLPRLFAAMNGPTTDASNFRNKFLRNSQYQLTQFRRR